MATEALIIAGWAVLALGAAAMATTVYLGRKTQIRKAKEELSLITTSGFASQHTEVRKNKNIYREGVIKNDAIPKRERTVSESARKLLQEVEAERLEEKISRQREKAAARQDTSAGIYTETSKYIEPADMQDKQSPGQGRQPKINMHNNRGDYMASAEPMESTDILEDFTPEAAESTDILGTIHASESTDVLPAAENAQDDNGYVDTETEGTDVLEYSVPQKASAEVQGTYSSAGTDVLEYTSESSDSDGTDVLVPEGGMGCGENICEENIEEGTDILPSIESIHSANVEDTRYADTEGTDILEEYPAETARPAEVQNSAVSEGTDVLEYREMKDNEGTDILVWPESTDSNGTDILNTPGEGSTDVLSDIYPVSDGEGTDVLGAFERGSTDVLPDILPDTDEQGTDILCVDSVEQGTDVLV